MGISLAVGSSYQTPAGAWTGGNFFASANQFNFLGTNGNVFELFDVQLVEGTVAPSFQVPHYDSELLACLRYYWKELTPTWIIADGISAGPSVNTLSFPFAFPVVMRAAPVATLPAFSTNGLAAAPIASPTTPRGMYITATSNAPVSGRMYFLYGSGPLIANARLT
jgi:hypothetical protein